MTRKSRKFFSYCGSSTESFSHCTVSSMVQLWTGQGREVVKEEKQEQIIIKCGGVSRVSVWVWGSTFGGLPAPPQLLHGDVLVLPVQVAVLVGLLLLHVLYDKLRG